MNALVALPLVLVRNSLILIDLMLRTFSVAVTLCRGPFAGFVHEALAIRSPLKAAGPDVTVKVVLTLAPGATESNVCEVSVVPGMTELHPLSGTEMLNFTATARDPVVFVNVTVDC